MMLRLRLLNLIPAAGMLLLAAACQTPSASPVAARMMQDKTTETCIAQMQDAAASPGSPKVVLTRAAFAAEDRLSIVPAELTDAAGVPRDGRQRGVPESYRLTLQDGRCIMTRERDGKAVPLPACSCVAMQ
jgi:hypothetical protein